MTKQSSVARLDRGAFKKGVERIGVETFTASMQSSMIGESAICAPSCIDEVDKIGARPTAAFTSVSKASSNRLATLPIGCPSKVA